MKDSSFSSLDRLIEFGMDISIAQQMINTMNHSICNMYTPNIGQHSIEHIANGFYAVIDNRQIGPLFDEEISKLVFNGSISEDTFMWKSGMSGWKQARDIPAIFKHIVLNRK